MAQFPNPHTARAHQAAAQAANPQREGETWADWRARTRAAEAQARGMTDAELARERAILREAAAANDRAALDRRAKEAMARMEAEAATRSAAVAQSSRARELQVARETKESAARAVRNQAGPPIQAPEERNAAYAALEKKHRLTVREDRRAALDDALREAGISRERFASTFQGAPGYRVDLVAGNKRDAGLSFSSRITYRGKEVGAISRTITTNPNGKRHVSHDLFELRGEHQRKKGGAWMIGNQFKAYEKHLNVEQVEVHAAWVGKYNWAKVGFEMDAHSINMTTPKIADALDRHVRDKLIDKAKAAELLATYRRDPTEFARLTDLPVVEFHFIDQQGTRQDTKGMINKAAMMDHLAGHWGGTIDVGTERWKEARGLLDASVKKKR